MIGNTSKELCKNMLTLTGNIIFPPMCALCQMPSDSALSLCSCCFKSLRFIADPCCSSCGTPFEFVQASPVCTLCDACAPRYDRARSALYYDSASSPLIARFKFFDGTHLAKYLASFMIPHAVQMDIDVITAVPLHAKRLRWRRYNQSILLAQHIAKHMSVPLDNHLLKRLRHNVPQSSLNMLERKDNVAEVFDVPSHKQNLLKGAKVLLVDDVITTGATVEACCDTLKKYGAAWVGVVTLAKRILDE